MIPAVTPIVAQMAGTDVGVAVVLAAHAVERYIERVQPCADGQAAVSQIARLFSLGIVEPRPAEWDATQRPALMYLTVGDVSFVLDVDAADRERLVARTCVTSALCRSTSRRLRRRLRGAPERVRHQGRAWERYRRPAPGQLNFQDDSECF